MERYRIKTKPHYVFYANETHDYCSKVYRPVVQMRIFKFFWITIKKFVCYNPYIANTEAHKLLNILNKKYKYEQI